MTKTRILSIACLVFLLSTPSLAHAQANDTPALNACRAQLDIALTEMEAAATGTAGGYLFEWGWNFEAPSGGDSKRLFIVGHHLNALGVNIVWTLQYLEDSNGPRCEVQKGDEYLNIYYDVDHSVSNGEAGQWYAVVRRTIVYLDRMYPLP